MTVLGLFKICIILYRHAVLDTAGMVICYKPGLLQLIAGKLVEKPEPHGLL